MAVPMRRYPTDLPGAGAGFNLSNPLILTYGLGTECIAEVDDSLGVSSPRKRESDSSCICRNDTLLFLSCAADCARRRFRASIGSCTGSASELRHSLLSARTCEAIVSCMHTDMKSARSLLTNKGRPHQGTTTFLEPPLIGFFSVSCTWFADGRSDSRRSRTEYVISRTADVKRAAASTELVSYLCYLPDTNSRIAFSASIPSMASISHPTYGTNYCATDDVTETPPKRSCYSVNDNRPFTNFADGHMGNTAAML